MESRRGIGLAEAAVASYDATSINSDRPDRSLRDESVVEFLSSVSHKQALSWKSSGPIAIVIVANRAAVLSLSLSSSKAWIRRTVGYLCLR